MRENSIVKSARYQEIKERYKAARALYLAETEQAIFSLISIALEHPDIKCVACYGYTPSFNDGEPCVNMNSVDFNFHELFISEQDYNYGDYISWEESEKLEFTGRFRDEPTSDFRTKVEEVYQILDYGWGNDSLSFDNLMTERFGSFYFVLFYKENGEVKFRQWYYEDVD